MRILDRYIIKSFIINYVLALGVMVGMYTLLDLIVNFENFTKGATVAVATTHPASTSTAPASTQARAERAAERAAAAAAAANPPVPTALDILGDMVDYYSYQILVIFQQISGAIPLLAAGFTMVRITRHQELTAMLSSGVSLYRVAAPIILVSMGISVVHVLNQEFLISQPFVIEKLLRKHDEVNQTTVKADAVDFVVDADNLISAKEYDPTVRPRQMKNVFIVQRDKHGMAVGHIYADTATWEIPAGETSEMWVLNNVIIEDDRADVSAQNHVATPLPEYHYQTGMTPEQLDLIFQKKAVDYLSSAQVRKLAEYSPEINKPMLYKIMYQRFTQPMMNIIMLLIGIPFLLTREPNKLIFNMFYCMIVSGVVFIATFVLFQMGGVQLDPLIAAWLPVLIFAPFAAVMMDMIKT